MDKAAVLKLAKAIGAVHGHPDPDAYAAAVADAYGPDSKPVSKAKGAKK